MRRHKHLKKPGLTFNHLTSIEPVQTPEEIAALGNSHVWRWQCECGNTKEAVWYNVAYGRQKSCGCMAYDTTTGRKRGRPAKNDPRYTLADLSYRGTPLPDLARELGMSPRQVLDRKLKAGEI